MGAAMLVQGIWGLVELMRKEMKLDFFPSFLPLAQPTVHSVLSEGKLIGEEMKT